MVTDSKYNCNKDAKNPQNLMMWNVNLLEKINVIIIK